MTGTQGESASTRAVGENRAEASPRPRPPRPPSVGEVLGEVLWLMSQSPGHRHLTLADMDWLVVPAIMNRQFKIFRLERKPFAYASWAFLAPEVTRRMAEGGARLSPSEWKCGEEAWVVDVVAPFGGAENVLKELKAKLFADRLLMTLSREGESVVAKEVAA